MLGLQFYTVVIENAIFEQDLKEVREFSHAANANEKARERRVSVLLQEQLAVRAAWSE